MIFIFREKYNRRILLDQKKKWQYQDITRTESEQTEIFISTPLIHMVDCDQS